MPYLILTLLVLALLVLFIGGLMWSHQQDQAELHRRIERQKGKQP